MVFSIQVSYQLLESISKLELSIWREKLLNFKSGILLDKKDLRLSLPAIIRELMELFWSMISLINRASRISRTGSPKSISSPMTMSWSCWSETNPIWKAREPSPTMRENSTLIPWELNFWRPPPKAPAKSMSPSSLLPRKSNKEFPRPMTLPTPLASLLDNKEEELRSVIQLRRRKNPPDVAEEVVHTQSTNIKSS